MMKKIILILFLSLIQFISFGQKRISGSFITSKKDIGWESDLFQFKKDGTFKYGFFTCTGTGFGIGNYEITENDSLKLYFKDYEPFKNNDGLKISTKDNDSLKINLKIISTQDGYPLVGANCVFKNTQKGFSVDFEGNASFVIQKFKEDMILEISYVGFENQQILIPKEASEITGTIKLLLGVWVYSSKENKSFKILNNSGSKIKLQRYSNHSILYDKISSKKASKIVNEIIDEKTLIPK